MKNDVVYVTPLDFAGEVEKTTNTFLCECGFKGLEEGFKYCPDCGKKIEWGNLM